MHLSALIDEIAAQADDFLDGFTGRADANLKQRDPRWGLRRAEDFAAAAADKGFQLADWRRMPANNLMLLFRKTKAERT